MNSKLGILVIAVIVISTGTLLYINYKNAPKVAPQKEEIVEKTQQPVEEEKETSNKICEWVDNSDIIIKVNIPEGIEKENSYEAGFYFNPIVSTMRLARKECDYRTGFSFAELKGKKAADVGVRNYSDSTRRVLVGEPIDVTFDSNGVPNIGPNIEVTILE